MARRRNVHPQELVHGEPHPARFDPMDDDALDEDDFEDRYPDEDPAGEFPDEMDEEDYDEEEIEGRSIMFLLAATIVSVALIGWGLYGLHEVIDRGYLDQYTYDFGEVRFLPDRQPEDAIRHRSPDKTVRLYYTGDGRTLVPYLYPTRRAVNDPEKARLILKALFTPPRGAMFRSAMPQGTRLRNYFQVGATAYLDLSKEFLEPENPTPLGERIAVYASVNSIVLNDVGVEAVQLLVDGQTIETAWGWLDCSSPLGANLSIVAPGP